MFEVAREELSRSQIVTLNKSRGSNITYLRQIKSFRT
ncbi:MAG: hypothetical protein LBG47_03480 [Prevotellaceae bacterium]|nr:hypothetical protein [Prevotellaceae bacterium]